MNAATVGTIAALVAITTFARDMIARLVAQRRKLLTADSDNAKAEAKVRSIALANVRDASQIQSTILLEMREEIVRNRDDIKQKDVEIGELHRLRQVDAKAHSDQLAGLYAENADLRARLRRQQGQVESPP